MLSLYTPQLSTGLTPGMAKRRLFLQAGGAGLLGLSLPKVAAAESFAATQATSSSTPRAKSIIFLLLFGGPSQLETFDMKPEAADGIRGPFRPICCRTPGLLMCEHLPKIANITDRICVLRTMSHSFNDHSGGAHYIQTGKRWHVPIGGGFSPTPKDWPSVGSLCEYQSQSANRASSSLPAYMVIPNSLGRLQDAGQYPRPGEHAGWLGARYNPLTTKVDKRSLTDNPYWRDCSDDELQFELPSLRFREGMTVDRMQARMGLLEQWQEQKVHLEESVWDGLDVHRQRAAALVTSPATRQALDIRQETEANRDRYGRHLFGQSCLMARRLVEAGVRFVTVHYDCVDGYSWDSHRNSADVKKHLLPTFDQAYSALITDLEERGLLSETLVVATGEMGRTPKANAEWGRDHWSTLFPALLAGGGVPAGGLVGASDRDAAYPKDRPISPEDLAATLYQSLGIDPEMRIQGADGRPAPLVEGGRPIFG